MTHIPAGRDTDSFRDPAGRVFRLGGRILRSVADRAAADYEYVRDRNLLDRWTDRSSLEGIPTAELNALLPLLLHHLALAVRGASPASHRGRRGAPLARRDDREYREYFVSASGRRLFLYERDPRPR